MSEGFYLFKFHNYDGGQTILDDGSWFVHGHPLVLRRWMEDIVMHSQNFETNLVWVRFSNLNFCFRTSSALSKLASVIGKPICIDHAIAAGTRFSFARVCIEVRVDVELPAEIRMKYKDKSILQKVEYAWKPNPFKICHTFDHGDKACPLKGGVSKPKQIWAPKKKQVGDNCPKPPEGTVLSNVSEKEWNVVKRKKPVEKERSPVAKSNRSTSPKIIEPASITSPGKSNIFSSLSNLKGESTASVKELEATTALIFDNSDADDDRLATGITHQKPLSSIHHLDKNLLPKLANSSAKHKSVSTGIVIKEKNINKTRS